MKKLLFLLPVILLLASCRNSDSTVVSMVVNKGGWIPTYDSAGKQLLVNHQQLDTVLTVQPSTAEMWAYGARRGAFWGMGVGLAIIIGTIFWFYKRTNSGDDKGAYVPVLLIGIIVGGLTIGTSLYWWSNQTEDIPKPQYDALMKNPGNLAPFWKTKQQ